MAAWQHPPAGSEEPVRRGRKRAHGIKPKFETPEKRSARDLAFERSDVDIKHFNPFMVIPISSSDDFAAPSDDVCHDDDGFVPERAPVAPATPWSGHVKMKAQSVLQMFFNQQHETCCNTLSYLAHDC